ncbi:TetR/AcrR family transcriptional regulator [Spirosoma validum]|uniref:TetR/AcrR family transcriptional regulator n=1 Tax=Spirosoma validum TaxID=2771355 RepID=A0A927B8M6_9BACT|nr:TetR/AcrR family transcriptional regulator [Spirosoma validum]MBD2757500.1 TetR/AcrR family transcriptional regulator [Spirosoma validum]
MHKQAEIRQRIMNALEEVMSEQGMMGVSVGVIAQKANVNKGLIYRHFGGVKGLLNYYIRDSNAFPHFTLDYLEQLSLVQSDDAARLWSGLIIQFFRQLRSSKASREVLINSLVRDKGLAETIHQTQHQQLTGLLQRGSPAQEADSPAILAILLGGLYYLTILAHNNQPMLGIDLRSEAGWQGVEESIRLIYSKLTKSDRHAHSLRDQPLSTHSQAA